MDSLKMGTLPIPDINIIEEGSLITIGNNRTISVIVDDYSNVDRE